MEYGSYEDWYDNGPGSEAFKRSCLKGNKTMTTKKKKAKPITDKDLFMAIDLESGTMTDLKSLADATEDAIEWKALQEYTDVVIVQVLLRAKKVTTTTMIPAGE